MLCGAIIGFLQGLGLCRVARACMRTAPRRSGCCMSARSRRCSRGSGPSGSRRPSWRARRTACQQQHVSLQHQLEGERGALPGEHDVDRGDQGCCSAAWQSNAHNRAGNAVEQFDMAKRQSRTMHMSGDKINTKAVLGCTSTNSSCTRCTASAPAGSPPCTCRCSCRPC